MLFRSAATVRRRRPVEETAWRRDDGVVTARRRRDDGSERQRHRCEDDRQQRQRRPPARRRRPLAAAAPLGDEDGVEEGLLPKMAAWGRKIRGAGSFSRPRFPPLIRTLGFPSDSRHQFYVFRKTGL